MESESDLTWNADCAIIDNPSSGAFFAPNYSTSENPFLPLAIQPLLTTDPCLRDVTQSALQSSDAVCSLHGGLSRHETAAVWMLLHPSEWQNTYQRLQNSLIKNDKDGLDPFRPYLKLLNGALQLLPKLRGNLWYYCHKDVHHLYQTGVVFSWKGFLRCKVQTEITSDESNLQTAKTIFCIQTSSGRIVVPFSHYNDKNIPVVICPSTFFQVTSLLQLRENVFVIELKEIHSPYAIDPTRSPVPDQDSQGSSQQYWGKLLQNMDPVTSSTIFLTAQNIARATGCLPLYCSFLKRLSEMPSFRYTNDDKALLFSTILKEMQRFPCYIGVQLFGSSVFNSLYSDEEFRTSQVVGKEVQNVIQEAMHNHKKSTGMAQTGLKLLQIWVTSSIEFDKPQQIVDIVLSAMKYHSEEVDIQVLGCSLLDSLSHKSEYVSLITERQGMEVIENTIRVLRGDNVATETCWRILLRLVRHTNFGDCTSDGNQDKNVDSFFEVLKDVLKAFSKIPSIQREGLLTLKEALGISAICMSEDTSFSELTIAAIRNHTSNESIVDCSFGILVEFSKSSKLTEFLIIQEALTCISSVMSQHFNVANIQENGCKILRNIAQNGCRGYRKDWDIILGISAPVSDSQENRIDLRLKIVESGGIDVIISAMKTHPNHKGIQQEGCLTIGTLSVNAANVVESRGQEDVRAVLAIFFKITDDVILQTAVLRTLAILTIHPSNTEFVVLNNGVECILGVLRAFPASGKLFAAGVVTLGNISKTTDGAVCILRRNGLEFLLMLMESKTESAPILAYVCTILANLCSLPRHLLKTGDLVPIDIMFKKGGYHSVINLMNRFPESLQLQKESSRVICTLPPDFATRKLKNKHGITAPVFKCALNVSKDVELLSLRCRAVGCVITFPDSYSPAIPDEIIDFVLSLMQQYPSERDLMKECCTTLSVFTVSGVYILRTLFYKGGVICMLNCLKQHQTDRKIVVLCLQILNYFTSQLTRTVWELLNPFQTPLRELTRQQLLSVGGLETLLEIAANNLDDNSILLLVAPLLLVSFSRHEQVRDTELFARINKLLTEIRNHYSEEHSSIHLFCDELSNSVNL